MIISMRWLQSALRLAAMMAAIGLPMGLFYGAAQPVAVGLIPPPWDKLAHVAVFAVLAGAIGYAGGWRGARMWWLTFAAALAMGAADEWHQLSLPGRGPGWDDLVADAVGAALGATALRWRMWVNRWVEVRMGADC